MVEESTTKIIITKEINHDSYDIKYVLHNKISHNKVTMALLRCRLPYKIRTHPICLLIGFLIFRNINLTRITTKAHGSWNTARERL